MLSRSAARACVAALPAAARRTPVARLAQRAPLLDQTSINARNNFRLESQMTPEELHALKLEAMRPYRKRNMTLAVGLFAGVGAIFAYTMYMMRPDDFDRIENMDKYKK